MSLEIRSTLIGLLTGLLLAAGVFWFWWQDDPVDANYQKQEATIDSLYSALQMKQIVIDLAVAKAARSDSIAKLKDSLLNLKFNEHEKADRLRAVAGLNDSSQLVFGAKWLSESDSL